MDSVRMEHRERRANQGCRDRMDGKGHQDRTGLLACQAKKEWLENLDWLGHLDYRDHKVFLEFRAIQE